MRHLFFIVGALVVAACTSTPASSTEDAELDCERRFRCDAPGADACCEDKPIDDGPPGMTGAVGTTGGDPGGSTSLSLTASGTSTSGVIDLSTGDSTTGEIGTVSDTTTGGTTTGGSATTGDTTSGTGSTDSSSSGGSSESDSSGSGSDSDSGSDSGTSTG